MADKIIIIGGVAGGASFAARMRRLNENAQITMFEKGPYVSFANCGLPYHIGETIQEREKLIVQTPEAFKDRYNVDVRVSSEVTAVDPEKKRVHVKAGDSTYTADYDYLLVAPGASPLRPPIPGIDSEGIFTLRNIPDMDRIKGRVDSGDVSRAVVIGGGFIGLETAENMRHRGIDVTLVELSDQVFMPADKEMANILHQHMALNGIDLILSDGAKKFVSRGGGAVDVVLNSGTELSADLVVLAIGVKPDTAFLKESGLQMNDRGAIQVDEGMKTNLPDVYAVGDAVEVTEFISGRPVSIPLAGPANRQGRIAADRIAGRKSSYKKTQGTSICKVFDLAAGVTGLNEKNAQNWGISYRKSYTHSTNHASYYPDAYQMSLKMLFDPADGTVLGVQIIGREGVDKRIDVFATAIRHGLTVYDLTELELAYAPPYGSAKDAVNMAGFVAENILSGDHPVIYSEEIRENFDPKKQILLDVRTEEEWNLGTIDGAVLIPVDSLRDRLDELDKHKEIIPFCQIGLRGYIALRILQENGFTARNLSGGYKTYSFYVKDSFDAGFLTPISDAKCSSPEKEISTASATVTVDACGLQCPGPIMRLKKTVEELSLGEMVEITATEEGFAMDVPAWCSRTGNTLVTLDRRDGKFVALVKKGGAKDSCAVDTGGTNKKTMVVFSNDFDKMMATFIIANGAASMGSEVVLFFTFWGLNLLRKGRSQRVKKSFMEKMFSMMMPKGSTKTSLSKMNMGGLGTIFMKKEMKKKNVFSLETLMKQAQENNVKLVACTMSMDIMGIKKEELIDGVEFGGVASYLNEADDANFNLFI
ncbi:MAG: FAD-dependent oxidoreductase [Fibrobacterota bacterium]